MLYIIGQVRGKVVCFKKQDNFMEQKDYYRILGVDSNAAHQELAATDIGNFFCAHFSLPQARLLAACLMAARIRA